MNRHRLLVGWNAREVLRDGIGHPHLPIGLERKNRGGCELLRAGANIENGVGLPSPTSTMIREPVDILQEGTAPLSDGYGPRKPKALQARQEGADFVRRAGVLPACA